MTIYPPWPLKKARITTWITPEKEPHPNEKTTHCFAYTLTEAGIF
jgi:hypothetical protein